MLNRWSRLMMNQEHLEILKQGVKVWNDWRKANPEVVPNLSRANLRELDLSEVDFKGAKLLGVNLAGAKLNRSELSGATLSLAYLIGVNFSAANLSNADLSNANLSRANLSRANLWGADFREANLRSATLVEADLSATCLVEADLREAELRGAILMGAILDEANLSQADFREANLSCADLVATQVLATRFEKAILTGVCIKDWHTNSATNFNDVICDYVYLEIDQQECRPHSRNFQPGEFTKLFQKVFETVDIVFLDGIEWKAFLLSFLELKAETGSDEISIQSFENRSGAFIVRINVPPDADKAEIERFIEEKYKIALEAKDKHIASLEEQILARYHENTELRSDLVRMAFKMSETKKTENNFKSYAMELQEEDYQHVIEQDKKRFSVLRAIYRDSGGKSNLATNSYDICQITGIYGEDLLHILEYLEKEDLIKAVTSLYAMYGGNAIVRITHKGMREVEAAMKKPDQPTNHFPAQVFYTTINAPLGALQQAGEGNSFTINQNIASNSNNEPSQE